MVTEFAERVYSIVRTVPKGKVTTYKDIAHALGTGAYRGVGQALKENPYAPEVPCHRVVSADGSIGGFFGQTEGEPVQRKIAMLQREGVAVEGNRVVDFERRRHSF
jgi:methylated-DNA-[protein]-cysteine S-methyltransferase